MGSARHVVVVRRVSAVVGTLLLALLSGCSGQSPLDEPSPPPAGMATSSSGWFAFATPTQLGVVRDGAVVATVATTAEPRYPTFTDSGRFVAAAVDGGQIVASGLTAGSARTISSHTDRVFAGIGDTITWWEDPDRLVTLDLSNPSSVPDKKVVAGLEGAEGPLRLVSFAAGLAVFVQEGAGSDGGDELAELGDDESLHRVGPAPDTHIRVAYPRPDGQAFAYAHSLRSACPKNSVNVVTATTGRLASPPMPYNADSIATTQRIWWDAGVLHMSLAERPCAGSDGSASKLTAWKLDRDSWVTANMDDVLVSRPLGSDAAAVVTPTQLKPPRGVLWVESQGERSQIAEDVTDLAVPINQPQSSA